MDFIPHAVSRTKLLAAIEDLHVFDFSSYHRPLPFAHASLQDLLMSIFR